MIKNLTWDRLFFFVQVKLFMVLFLPNSDYLLLNVWRLDKDQQVFVVKIFWTSNSLRCFPQKRYIGGMAWKLLNKPLEILLGFYSVVISFINLFLF